jgi:hypothetical protein
MGLLKVLFPAIVMASPVVLADSIVLVPEAAMRTPWPELDEVPAKVIDPVVALIVKPDQNETPLELDVPRISTSPPPERILMPLLIPVPNDTAFPLVELTIGPVG